MPNRPCILCNTPTPNTRCPRCEATHQQQRGTRTQRGYDNDWLRIRDAVLDRDGHTCYLCGHLATTADHITPLAKGGPRLDPTNLRACCTPCNSRKRDR